MQEKRYSDALEAYGDSENLIEIPKKMSKQAFLYEANFENHAKSVQNNFKSHNISIES